jgi:hypothetical protein
MKRVLIFAAVAEATTGVALLIAPSLVGQLLLGEHLTGVAIPVARVAGIALIGLGIACWPGPPLVGMLTYNAAVTVYFANLGFAGGLTGILLWPVIALHLGLTGLLILNTSGAPRQIARGAVRVIYLLARGRSRLQTRPVRHSSEEPQGMELETLEPH